MSYKKVVLTVGLCLVFVAAATLYFSSTAQGPEPENTPQALPQADVGQFNSADNKLSKTIDEGKKNILIRDFYEGDYYPLAATGSPYPLYPDNPLDVYQEHIQDAEQGDGRAMYWVSRALLECTEVGDPAEAEREFALHNINDEGLLNIVVARYQRCEDLLHLVGPEALADWLTHYEWLVEANESGDALAQVWFFRLHPDRYSQQDAKSIVTRALQEGGPENMSTFEATRVYLANYTAAGIDNNTDWALALSRCELQQPHCNYQRLKRHIEHVELPTDYEQIISISESLVSALKSGNIDGLL